MSSLSGVPGFTPPPSESANQTNAANSSQKAADGLPVQSQSADAGAASAANAVFNDAGQAPAPNALDEHNSIDIGKILEQIEII